MTNSEEAHKLVATAGLLLMDAMVFQEVIASFHPQVPTLSSLVATGNVKRSLEDCWESIISGIDYVPIFDIALQILRNLPATPTLQSNLKSLVSVAYDIASSRVLLRHDLFGRIYHQLLFGKLAKYYATFYTSISAARMLARLVANLPSKMKLDRIPPTYDGQPLKIVDFACGSGTLLSAVYKEIDGRHRVEAKRLRIPELHKYLIEEGIWGFDVLYHAVHLASTALSLHNPAPIIDSRLYRVPLGKELDAIHLGSVDFLVGSELTLRRPLLPTRQPSGAQVVAVSRKEFEKVVLPKFHLCLMNPPFARSVGGNLLFGSLPKPERAELQKKLSMLLKEADLRGIGQAGLGAIFTLIADKHLAEGGRVGLVLPRSFLSGVSWEKVREQLMEDYHIEYVITSYEGPDDWNFSENISYSEILLTARKLRTREKAGYTLYVSLWRKPKPTNEGEAIYISSQLIELYSSARLYDIENSNASPYYLKLHGRKIGEVYSAKIEDNDLGIYNFFSQMELNRTVALLLQGTVYLPDEGVVGRVPLRRLEELGAEIGPDVRQIHDAFRASEYQPTHVYKALWDHESDTVRTIEQEPNRGLDPKDDGKARSLWTKAGNFLIAERAWLPTYRVLSTYVSERVLSNVWWPVKMGDDKKAKTLSLWLNSTLGQLLFFSQAEVTRGPWVKFKKERLRNLRVLDLTKIDERKEQTLLDLYERVRRLQLKRLPEEFANPEARRTVDEGISGILKIEAPLDTLYKLLSVDPMVTAIPLP